MSLLHRVSSNEVINRRSSRADDSSPQARKLSFSPIAVKLPLTPSSEPVGAYEVSSAKRILQVGTGVLYCLLAAGPVFGYAALKPVLIAEGVYSDACKDSPIDEGGAGTCFEQELRLNFMFTVAAVATNVVALPVGTILDRFGPRVASLIGTVFGALGAAFMAWAAEAPFDGWVVGYFFLALGGAFVFIPAFQLSNTFPRYSGLILALLTGAFDTSSALFLVYRLIYSGTNGSFKPKKFFLIYLVVPAFILVAQLLWMPKNSYKTVGELVQKAEQDEHEIANGNSASSNGVARGGIRRDSTVADEVTGLLGSPSAEEHSQREDKKQDVSGVFGALHHLPASKQIRTPWFWLITAFTVLQMLRINYFVATVRPQYAYILGSYEAAVRVNSFFDVALPLGGIVSIPFIGLLLDNTSTPFVLGMLVSIATTIGVLGVLPYEWAAYANVVLFVMYRPLYYTAVSDYAAKVFGFATFGKVYGLIICLAGICNFLQSVLDALTHRAFANDPRPVNIGLLLAALLVGIALVAYVAWRSRSIRRELLEDEAEGARESLMPGADAERVAEDRHPREIEATVVKHKSKK